MRSSDWSSYVCSSDLTEPVSLSCHVSLAGTQRVNRGLLLSGSRGPRTVWRFRNIEGSRRLDDARKVITDKKEPSDVGGAREASLRSSHLSTEDRMDRIFTAFARTIASWTRSEEHTSELQSLMSSSYA